MLAGRTSVPIKKLSKSLSSALINEATVYKLDYKKSKEIQKQVVRILDEAVEDKRVLWGMGKVKLPAHRQPRDFTKDKDRIDEYNQNTYDSILKLLHNEPLPIQNMESYAVKPDKRALIRETFLSIGRPLSQMAFSVDRVLWILFQHQYSRNYSGVASQINFWDNKVYFLIKNPYSEEYFVLEAQLRGYWHMHLYSLDSRLSVRDYRRCGAILVIAS